MMAGWRPSARNAIIDLGPGAGQDGGRVVLTGTPADLVAHGDSLTARHLRTYLQVAGA
jgi:excinuclease UvrABC ATPase subunit